MTDPAHDLAMRELRARIEHLFEIATRSPGTDLAEEAPEIAYREAAFFIEEGPVAYLRYVQALNDAAVRADMERHLRSILGGQP